MISENAGKNLFLGCFFVAVCIITWDEIKNEKTFPRPQRYVSAGAAFGLLGVATPVLTFPITGMLALGILLALMYKVLPKSKSNQTVDV